MDVFQRSIHSNVKQTDEDHYLVTSQLLDLEHSFHLEISIRLSTREIELASATMSKAPFDRCLAGTQGLEQLVGLRVERGVMGRVQQKLGGPRGCAHMVELVTDAIRLLAMLLSGTSAEYWDRQKRTMTEEELIDSTRDKLRNSCLVFADE